MKYIFKILKVLLEILNVLSGQIIPTRTRPFLELGDLYCHVCLHFCIFSEMILNNVLRNIFYSASTSSTMSFSTSTGELLLIKSIQREFHI